MFVSFVLRMWAFIQFYRNPALPDYPQNVQLAAHFREFLKDGYRVGAEAVEVKFQHADGSRRILPSSVGISDGFAKVVIMCGIVLICHKLETRLHFIYFLPSMNCITVFFRVWHVAKEKLVKLSVCRCSLGTDPRATGTPWCEEGVGQLPLGEVRVHAFRESIAPLPLRTAPPGYLAYY